MDQVRSNPNLELGARIRQLRNERKLTLRSAEQLTGVSRAMLSKIERGTASPTATVLGRVAEGFRLSISELLGGPRTSPDDQVILLRKPDQQVFSEPASGFQRRSLSPLSADGIDLAFNALPPRQSSGTFPGHRSGSRELLTVAEGHLVLHLDEETHELSEGDSIFFRAHRDHRFQNPSDTEPAVFYIVIINR